MVIPIKTSCGEYDVILERSSLKKAGEYLPLERKVLIVTDSGVPAKYAETVAECCKEPYIVTIKEGELSKQIDTYTMLLRELVSNEFTRTDCVVAVGGGVVGDLSGFTASTYMRGIDFYNIPTTVLSQVDSSIGGKTAIDFMGLKNIVGAFYPPKRVLIDSDTISTLPQRHISNGLAEALKMSLTCDEELFKIFESADISDSSVMDTVIARSLAIKKNVVEQDEHEQGLRMVLNFGHTIAHALESVYSMDTYYHGECVAIGMIPMCSDKVRKRLLPVLHKLGLPAELVGKADALIDACRHDKKTSGKDITVVYVPEIGKFELKKIAFDELEKIIRQGLKK